MARDAEPHPDDVLLHAAERGHRDRCGVKRDRRCARGVVRVLERPADPQRAAPHDAVAADDGIPGGARPEDALVVLVAVRLVGQRVVADRVGVRRAGDVVALEEAATSRQRAVPAPIVGGIAGDEGRERREVDLSLALLRDVDVGDRDGGERGVVASQSRLRVGECAGGRRGAGAGRSAGEVGRHPRPAGVDDLGDRQVVPCRPVDIVSERHDRGGGRRDRHVERVHDVGHRVTLDGVVGAVHRGLREECVEARDRRGEPRCARGGAALDVNRVVVAGAGSRQRVHELDVPRGDRPAARHRARVRVRHVEFVAVRGPRVGGERDGRRRPRRGRRDREPGRRREKAEAVRRACERIAHRLDAVSEDDRAKRRQRDRLLRAPRRRVDPARRLGRQRRRRRQPDRRRRRHRAEQFRVEDAEVRHYVTVA